MDQGALNKLNQLNQNDIQIANNQEDKFTAASETGQENK